jgi:DNA repair protein RadD
MLVLRDYQNEAVEKGYNHFRSGRGAGLIVLPTAAGKSLVIAELCHTLDEPVLILQPSKELLEQNYAKLETYGITDIGIFSASKRSKVVAKYTYATIGSIDKHPDQFAHFKYVLIDEAHLVAPGGRYTKFLKAIGNPRVVGLTATPYRLVTFVSTGSDGKRWSRTWLSMLTARGQFFDSLLYTKSIGELTQAGFLSAATYRNGMVPGTRPLKLNSAGTEFSELSLANYWTETTTEKLANWVEELPHDRILVFVPTLEMAAYMAQSLGTEMISGEMPDKQREHILKRFREGHIHTLVNVGVLTTGYDLPSLDAVVLARPTMSLSLYVQMVGRVLRVDPNRPDKQAFVYDFGGNIGRFGPVDRISVSGEGVWAGDKQITGTVLSEVCVSDIMAWRSAKTTKAAT